ncbi:MAG TPA: winged helix-turn-helix domain-containing protein [Pyrinomonadaceae bacterium]|jgi:Tol biopolymer transport system component/DNA-binding winged helix-turn-helix (wHTH) protein
MSASNLLKNRRLYEFGAFRLDTCNGLFVNEELVNLAPKVLQTLTLLVENSGRVISKDEFFEKIWTDTFVEDGALSFNISQLRKTLARFDKDTNFVETIPKRGFRFVAAVREIFPAENESEILIERRQTREIFLEETHEQEDEKTISAHNALIKKPLELQRFNLKAIAFPGAAILAAVLLVGFVRQFRQNLQLRSFDSIRSVKLTSWASLGSSSYSNYSASHDGKLIAYSSLKDGISESLFIRQFDGGEEIRITDDRWKNFNPIWSPDDKQIAFVSVRESQAGIYLCPFLGGTPTLLKIIGQGNLALTHWTKDGSAVFYEFDGNLFRLDIASKESSQVTDLPPSKTERYFAVSPDEAQIVFCDKIEEQTDLWILSPGGGGKSQRLTNDKETESRPFWHPDGMRIFYTARRDNHYQINLVYTSESEPVPVKRGDIEYKIIGISADGTKVFYANWQDKSDIWGLKTDTGEEFAVASEPESEFWTDISPDGKSMAFQVNSSSFPLRELSKSLIVVRALGEKRNQNLFNGYNPRWLPGGRQIAFLRLPETEQKENLWLFDTVNGVQKQLTTDGVSLLGHALLPYNRTQTRNYDWSPDGQKFIYPDEKKNNIWLCPASDGEKTNLTNNDNPNITFYSPLWSPDGKRIAFVSLRKPAATGEKTAWSVWLAEPEKPREIFSVPGSLRLLGWSSDASALFFEMTEEAMKTSPTDVRLLQISVDGNYKIINSFEKISALSMALSADAKNVAFTSRRDGKDNIYTSSTVTGETKKITNNSNPDFCFGSLEWSPDGKTIYFDKQEQIYTISMFENFN